MGIHFQLRRVEIRQSRPSVGRLPALIAACATIDPITLWIMLRIFHRACLRDPLERAMTGPSGGWRQPRSATRPCPHGM